MSAEFDFRLTLIQKSSRPLENPIGNYAVNFDHQLRDFFEIVLEDQPHYKYFRFYDSKDHSIFDFDQKLGDYVKTNETVIYFNSCVPLRFMDIKYHTLKPWCLNYQPSRVLVADPNIQNDIECTELLSTVLHEFKDTNGFSGHETTFFNSTGDAIVIDANTTVEMFFEDNGPLIYFDFKPIDDARYCYLSRSHDPHISPKRIRLYCDFRVDELSESRYSHLLEIQNNNILGFVSPSKVVQDLPQFPERYRLCDLNNNHSSKYGHFDVSVRFINGGTLFVGSILARAKVGETIASFMKNMLKNILNTERVQRISDYMNHMQIDIGDGKLKCTSKIKISPPTAMLPLPIYLIDASHLPRELKYCDCEHTFYFYNVSNPLDRISNTYKAVTAYGHHTLAKVLTVFANAKKLRVEKDFKFYNSRKQSIADLFQESVSTFARSNDLVIVYEIKN